MTSRAAPATDTMEEVRYLRRLAQTRKPVAVKLRDGAVVHGWIEYFDRNFIRLTREPQPNLFIYKWDIQYISEQPERRSTDRAASPNAVASGIAAEPQFQQTPAPDGSASNNQSGLPRTASVSADDRRSSPPRLENSRGNSQRSTDVRFRRGRRPGSEEEQGSS
jgi:host factor-I protein